VKFLVDNQLPIALARFLAAEGHDAQHVLDLRMDEADDAAVWAYAAAQGRTLVSKDEDFFHLAIRNPGAGTLIWVRLGNCRNQALISTFERSLDQLIAALQQGGRIIELR
jgi:predicted nuclease of predicted toxin-antitoxin system